MTDQPWLAYWAHSGRPILPAPMTATVPAVPGSPVHGFTIGWSAWRQAFAVSSMEPPSRLGAAAVGRLVIVM